MNSILSLGPWLVARRLAGMPAPADLDTAVLDEPWSSLLGYDAQ